MKDIERAILLATNLHRGQVDKSGNAYILHPLRVMLGFSDDLEMIVAVLHDVMEDCGYGVHELVDSFGREVADAVEALTRREDETYADFILRAKANPIARKVKIADIRDNLRPGAEHLRDRYLRALAVLEDGK